MAFLMRHADRFIPLCAGLVLGLALIFQYGFGYEPCALCYRQRWPYYLWIAIGAAGLIVRKPSVFLPISGLLGLGSAGLGLHHSGVENAWWAGPANCGGGLGDFDPLTQNALAIPFVACDQPSWLFLGLSMADYNMLISLGLALWAGLAWQRSSLS